MSRTSTFRRLSNDWPVYFTAAVVMWFVAAGLGATDISLDTNDSGGTTASTPSDAKTSSSDSATSDATKSVTDSPYNPAVTAGPLKIKVASFRLDADKKHPGMLNADVILELKNTTKSNVSFSPSQVSLRSGSDSSAPIPPKEAVVMGISPNIPMTAPLTFQISPDPGAFYQLRYAGNVLYDGLPF